jgi:indolepyruvate ferredoxin oxidoreductase beta subunit
VRASLAGFARGFAEIAEAAEAAKVVDPAKLSQLPAAPLPVSVPQTLRAELASLPVALQAIASLGVVRLADYQDQAYAHHYLERLRGMADWPSELANEAARYLALWMAYEDIVRVADLKCRATRFARVADEMRLEDQQLLAVNEYFHPRAAEIADVLPLTLGRVLLEEGLLARFFKASLGLNSPQGRIIRSNSVRGFLQLYAVASLRRFRPRSRRYAVEQGRIDRWLASIQATQLHEPALAAQIVQCARLVKGYSDTHARGLANFHRIMGRLEASPPPSAAQVSRWIDAALADDSGAALTTALEPAR